MTLSNKASQWVCRKTEATATATATATTSRRDSRSSTRTGGLRLDSDQPFSRRTSSSSSEYDAFTAQGVKVFFPDVGSWREVSVMGNVVSISFSLSALWCAIPHFRFVCSQCSTQLGRRGARVEF